MAFYSEPACNCTKNFADRKRTVAIRIQLAYIVRNVQFYRFEGTVFLPFYECGRKKTKRYGILLYFDYRVTIILQPTLEISF